MTANIVIDDNLVDEALILGHFKSREDAVMTALKEFIHRRKQMEIIELFGKLEPDPDYDNKQGRKA